MISIPFIFLDLNRSSRPIDRWARRPIKIRRNSLNKFGTNNDASWMKQDEDEDEDEDEEEDSLLTSEEPLRIITKLILDVFTV